MCVKQWYTKWRNSAHEPALLQHYCTVMQTIVVMVLFSLLNGLRSSALIVRRPWAVKRGNGMTITSKMNVVSRSQVPSTAGKGELGMSDVFKTIETLDVIGGSSVLLVSPNPEDYSFTSSRSNRDNYNEDVNSEMVTIKRGYDVEMDDICDDEILYGMRKETKNMQRK